MKQDIKKSIGMAALCGLCTTVAHGQIANYLFSTDIGSDLDMSDPSTPGTMDAGWIYTTVESWEDPYPWKGDDAQTSGWPGHPFKEALQPKPADIGKSSIKAYSCYFDLDGEDQVLHKRVFDRNLPTSLSNLEAEGIYSINRSVKLSFDNDGATGWAVSDNVPTASGPFSDDEIYSTALNSGGSSAPATPEVNETQLHLGQGPIAGGNKNLDDDVDALDWHPLVKESSDPAAFQLRLFSADHEANLGQDPGDIYYTDRTSGQNVNLMFDDVNDIGVADSTDIDAFEIVAIDSEWGKKVGWLLNSNEWVYGMIFSVDQDDPDTVGIDESGGLDPDRIYLSGLNGVFASASGQYGEDVDALTVIPEPSVLVLIGVCGGAMVFVRRFFAI